MAGTRWKVMTASFHGDSWVEVTKLNEEGRVRINGVNDEYPSPFPQHKLDGDARWSKKYFVEKHTTPCRWDHKTADRIIFPTENDKRKTLIDP